MIATLLAALALGPLDAILDDPKLSGSVVAAYVGSLDGQTLYERLPDVRVMPASNQKLVTGAYAFARLGPKFRFKTRFWKTGKGIVVDAGGDPMLTYDQLQKAGKALGIRKDTAVYVVQPFRARLGPSWEWDDLPNKYAAPVSGLTVDRSSFEIWAENGKAFYLPQAYGTAIVNHGGEGPPKVTYDPAQRVSIVSGKLPATRTRLDTLALPAPDQAAVKALGGTYAAGRQLPSVTPTLVIESPPLEEIARECLTKSDNNLAEMLLLGAAASEGPLGDQPYKKAVDRLSAWLKAGPGVSPDALAPQDGSGLSRHNLVTVRGLGKLLAWAANQPWGDVWATCLASPGVGTLSSRLATSSFKGKTGTIHLASALSGYATDASGRTRVISLVFNHFLCTASEARKIQDTFVTEIEASNLQGTLFASPFKHAFYHADHPSHPKPRRIDVYRVPRLVHHAVAAPQRADDRVESDHALLPAAR